MFGGQPNSGSTGIITKQLNESGAKDSSIELTSFADKLSKATKLIKKNFKSSHKINRELKQQSNLANQLDREINKTKFIQFKDPYFPGYNANHIRESNFIAASGPKNIADSIRFLKELGLNLHFEIKHIIALGDKVTIKANDSSNFDGDFYDYCDGNIQETITAKANYYGKEPVIEDKVAKTSRVIHQFEQCELQVEWKGETQIQGNYKKSNTIQVTRCHITDEYAIFNDLHRTGISIPFSDNSLEILFQLFKKSLTDITVVHCGAGVGRTGHLILCFELLKQFHEITACQNAEQIVSIVNSVVNRIRENRPTLIANIIQLKMALEVANCVYQYALEKKYIHENSPINDQLPFRLHFSEENREKQKLFLLTTGGLMGDPDSPGKLTPVPSLAAYTGGI